MSEENHQYNWRLCEERHKNIDSLDKLIELRFKKLENRFLMIMTALCLNLLGVIASLAVIIMKG